MFIKLTNGQIYNSSLLFRSEAPLWTFFSFSHSLSHSLIPSVCPSVTHECNSFSSSFVLTVFRCNVVLYYQRIIIVLYCRFAYKVTEFELLEKSAHFRAMTTQKIPVWYCLSHDKYLKFEFKKNKKKLLANKEVFGPPPY